MMQRMQIYLPEDMYIRLKQAAQEQDVSMADLVRKGVEKIVPANKQTKSKKQDPWKDFIGFIKGGPKTDATKVKKEYYENLV